MVGPELNPPLFHPDVASISFNLGLSFRTEVDLFLSVRQSDGLKQTASFVDLFPGSLLSKSVRYGNKRLSVKAGLVFGIAACCMDASDEVDSCKSCIEFPI